MKEQNNLSNEQDQDGRAQELSMSDLMILMRSSLDSHQKATQALQDLSKSIRIQANAIADLVEAVSSGDDDESNGLQTLDGR